MIKKYMTTLLWPSAVLITIIICSAASSANIKNETADQRQSEIGDIVSVKQIKFWNGNKTAARKAYEVELLEAILKITENEYGAWQLDLDERDYPLAEDEGSVLERGADLLVTIAGNKKFANKEKITIDQPITKGLLGYRILIINEQDLESFAAIETAEELQAKAIGIPATWGDADLFRYNDYTVVEKGSFDELFVLLKAGVFDYTALGANEIESAFSVRAEPIGNLIIEPNLLVYYPFPLVFYVHPDANELAQRIETGLKALQETGEFDTIFDRYYGDIVERLNLKQRKLFKLNNPALPESLKDFRSTLLD